MAVVRSALRTIKLVWYFTRFGVELLVTQPRTRQARAAWLHRFCAAAMQGLDVKLTVEGAMPAAGAVIANHLGYLDIIVFAALSPVVFCSKAEIAHWPVLGWMTTMAGTVYVDRGRGGSALKAKSGMEDAMDAGLPVVFFPEGTTSNGASILPFHSGLLAQVMSVNMPVTAAYLDYSFDQPNPRATIATDVNYWGEVNMLKHIWRFMGLRGVHATVRLAPGPIAFSADTLHRKQAAIEAQTAVAALRFRGAP